MDELKKIFNTADLLKFWPSANQSAKERVLATSRFIIYSTCIVYIINRDSRIFAVCILALAILYYLYNANMIVDGNSLIGDGRKPSMFRPEVQLPETDNVMGNVLLTDYIDKPDRPPAAWFPSVRKEVQTEWSKIHPFERQRDAERNFYTTASTTIPNDQTAFAEGAYGVPFSPMCKDQGGDACDPDRFYSGFPERVQMKGGNGGSGGGGSK